MDERLKVTLEGISQSFSSIPPPILEEALSFVFEFAKNNEYFNGGDILYAYRQAGLPSPHRGDARSWRNKWGALITKCAGYGWFQAVDVVKPTTRQSHTRTLTLWRSMLYTGERVERDTAKIFLDDLTKQVWQGKLTVNAALWVAYLHKR